MRSRVEANFLEEMEERLEENKKLSGGGLPNWLAPVASLMAVKSYEGLLLVAFMITLIWFLLWPLEFLQIIRIILLSK
jgi:hypothetical protein